MTYGQPTAISYPGPPNFGALTAHLQESYEKKNGFASTIVRVAFDLLRASPGNLSSNELCLAQISHPAQVTCSCRLKNTHKHLKSVRTIRLSGEVVENTVIDVRKYKTSLNYTGWCGQYSQIGVTV